jgi:UDPglucose 6-dehydrogenase
MSVKSKSKSAENKEAEVKNFKVNIVGAGFVGLTLAEVLSRLDQVEKVNVIDVDENKLKCIKEGNIPVNEPGVELKSPKITFSSKYTNSVSDTFFVCVGTPDMGNGTQNLDYLKSAIESILSIYAGKKAKPTIIIKSTTLPSNIAYLANWIGNRATLYTNPEFLAEGKAVDDLMHQHTLICGCLGITEDMMKCTVFFRDLFKGTYAEGAVHCINLYEAMVCKYFLNSYKAMKLDFINEFNTYCDSNNLSFNSVIHAVGNDPVLGKGFDKPGIGFGGSCFPKDTNAIGTQIQFIKIIHDLNETRIATFAANLSNYINANKVKNILFIGKSFKVGTNDTRESVSVKVANLLAEDKIEVKFFDTLPELSDFTLDEVMSKLPNIQLIVIFNQVPELDKIKSAILDLGNKVKCQVIDTRK